ncbi:AraC family transcriptional regulator [Sphingobacterium thalpophilum]|uniref:AraC family transcriptional regulator n=1 Tax=Sphingobacterium thalpophilum TaxID=259 RepID=UPI003C7816C6
MKPIHFKIPFNRGQSISVKEEILESFYPHLHCHQEAQLMWIVKGHGLLHVGDRVHPFQEGDIFFIAAYQPHVFKSMQVGQSKNEACSISIYFDPKGRLQQLFMLGEFDSLKQFLHQNTGGFKIPDDELESVSNRIMQIKTSDGIDKMMHFFYLLRTLSAISKVTSPLCLCDQGTQDDYAVHKSRISSICQYIELHFKEELTLESVAKRANLSPQAFCRYFKKHSGVTLVGYLNRLRVNEVCNRLHNDHLENISFIAYNCGFNSITNFNRIFKHIVGCTPKEYLLNHRKKCAESYREAYV